MNAYARNSKVAAYQSIAVHGAVSGADPHRLILILMDTALERMAAARGCIERRQIVQKAKLLHNCVHLVAELRGTLNMAEGGALAQNLSDLYDYMIRRLLRANNENDIACLTEVSSLLGEIRGAWAAIGPEVRPAPQPAPSLSQAASAA